MSPLPPPAFRTFAWGQMFLTPASPYPSHLVLRRCEPGLYAYSLCLSLFFDFLPWKVGMDVGFSVFRFFRFWGFWVSLAFKQENWISERKYPDLVKISHFWKVISRLSKSDNITGTGIQLRFSKPLLLGHRWSCGTITHSAKHHRNRQFCIHSIVLHASRSCDRNSMLLV